MAELPEVEILRRELERDVVGKKIKGVEVTLPAAVKRNTNKRQFAARLDGMKIDGVTRRGTTLLFGLDSGDVAVILLGDQGRLARTQAKEPVEKATSVVVTFTQTGQLRLIDPSKKAEMFVLTADEVDGVVGELGFDLVDEPVSWTSFGERLLRRQGKLKSILMDDAFVAGVGTMYSDEILFEAGLRYDRLPQSLSTQEIRRLYRAAVEVIHDAVKYGGASVGDDGWVNLAGKGGEYQLAVFKREGEMSPRARGPIIKARFGQGYTYYCEQTQM